MVWMCPRQDIHCSVSLSNVIYDVVPPWTLCFQSIMYPSDDAFGASHTKHRIILFATWLPVQFNFNSYLIDFECFNVLVTFILVLLNHSLIPIVRSLTASHTLAHTLIDTPLIPNKTFVCGLSFSSSFWRWAAFPFLCTYPKYISLTNWWHFYSNSATELAQFVEHSIGALVFYSWHRL